jgi:hypothetical protein
VDGLDLLLRFEGVITLLPLNVDERLIGVLLLLILLLDLRLKQYVKI